MFKIPQRIPLSALRRIVIAGPRCSPMQSCHQDIVVSGFTDANVQAWATAHPLAPYMSLVVTDVDNILPFTQLEFRIASTVAAGVDDAGLCNIVTTAGQTAPQVSITAQAQINAWAQNFGRTFRNLKSMRASRSNVSTSDFIIFMPWGMLSLAIFTPTGLAAATRFPGVDNPLFYSILGKRRHVFGVTHGESSYYYYSEQIIG